MKKMIPLIIIFTLIFSIGLYAKSEGIIKTVNGDVDIKLTKGGEWQKAEKDMEITQGTVISTGMRSKAIVELADGTIITVDQLTQFEFEDLLMSEKPGAVQKSDVGLKLKVGTVKAEVKKSEAVKSFKVTTPKGTASVRGTVLQVNYSENKGLNVICFSGQVVTSAKLEGRTLTVNQGKMTSIPPKGTDMITAMQQVIANTTPQIFSVNVSSSEAEALSNFGIQAAMSSPNNASVEAVNIFIMQTITDREKL